VPVPEPVTAENYQRVITSVLGVSAERPVAIAAEYPLNAYPSPPVAFSALVSDANFACPALQMDRWTSKWVPTFAYEFNDDHAPLRYPPLTGPPVTTHKSEFPYLFDLPDAPLQGRKSRRTSPPDTTARSGPPGEPSAPGGDPQARAEGGDDRSAGGDGQE
jgi:para-nitrobenzyl esterase